MIRGIMSKMLNYKCEMHNKKDVANICNVYIYGKDGAYHNGDTHVHASLRIILQDQECPLQSCTPRLQALQEP